MRIPAADRAMALIGYLPFLFLVPVKLKRDSIFAQFHGRQAGVLFGLWLLVVLAVFVALFAVGNAPQGVTVGLFSLMAAASLVYLLMMAAGMYKALRGERYRMPVVADVALLLGL